jgi:hypothetical protein
VIGGGNYIEYQNLIDNAKVRVLPSFFKQNIFYKLGFILIKAKSANTNIPKRIIYGCTEFINASLLINQVKVIYFRHNFKSTYFRKCDETYFGSCTFRGQLGMDNDCSRTNVHEI